MKNMSKKNSRREKWRNITINESNIDEYLLDLIEDTKGQYITQGVSFNKDDSLQMGLLKQSILDHSSFSGLVKHLLTIYFSGQPIQSPNSSSHFPISFHRTRDIQTQDEDVESTTDPKEVSELPITPKINSASVVAATRKSWSSPPVETKVDNTPKQQRQPAKRIAPKRPSGGGFLQANPNAKLPTDPSAN